MAKDYLSRKLAVILHADVVGSTELVQTNEVIAHERIRDAFQRFSRIIASYGGTAHEIRGDALVAEFGRASDSVSAALAYQETNLTHNRDLPDSIKPEVRIGISLGEVVIADGTITGSGIVLAQRLEQLCDPGVRVYRVRDWPGHYVRWRTQHALNAWRSVCPYLSRTLKQVI
jgi:adenylate cyclase